MCVLSIHHMYSGGDGAQMRCEISLHPNLEFGAVVSFLTWVVGAALRSSGKASGTLNHWTTSPATGMYLLYPLLPLMGEKWHWSLSMHHLQDEVFREEISCPWGSKNHVSDSALYLVGLMMQQNKAPPPLNTEATTKHKINENFSLKGKK